LPWPINGAIKRKFGKVQHPQFKTYILNNGIDIVAKIGTPVKAVADGEVVFSDWMPGYGMLIILDHGNGFHTSYSHNSELLVSAGTIVKQTQVIAYSGNTGSVMGALLHFEIRKEGQAQDPLKWLQKPS